MMPARKPGTWADRAAALGLTPAHRASIILHDRNHAALPAFNETAEPAGAAGGTGGVPAKSWSTAAAVALSVLAAFASATAPTELEAQVVGAADLTFRPTFIWRGLTRISSPSLQPAVSLGLQRESWMLTAGAWAALEPFDAGATEQTLVGRDAGLAGELDYWLQYDRRFRFLGTFDFAVGWIAYTFRGDPLEGGVGDDFNTSELYMRLEASELRELWLTLGLPDVPVAVELSTWKDLGPVGGVYSEPALEAELPVLFTGEPFGALIARAAAGLSWGQTIDAPGDVGDASGGISYCASTGACSVGYYDGSGFTHLDFSLGATPFVRLGSVPLTLYLAGHLQVGLDERTIVRSGAPEDRDRIVSWLDVTVSALLPVR